MTRGDALNLAAQTVSEASLKLAGRIRDAQSIDELRACPAYHAWQQAVEWYLRRMKTTAGSQSKTHGSPSVGIQETP